MASPRRESFFEQMLLMPVGKQTRIDRKHYGVINDYLSPGDRITWHRPYAIIHACIVLVVDADKKRICVFERSTNDNGIEVAPNWRYLDDEKGQLYRCDEDLEKIPFSKTLRIMLNKLEEKGYNIFAKNCQTLVDECTREGKESFQTKWFGVNLVLQAIKGFKKPITAELIETLFGGAEKIGVIALISFQILAFIMEFYIAYNRLKNGDISWMHFTEVVIRQFSMGFFSCIGSALGGSLVAVLIPKQILWVVLTVFGALIADALLDWVGSDNDFVRYLGWMAGGIVGFVCGCFSPSWVLEILLACLLGFAGMWVGHVFGYTASWLFNRASTDSRAINDINELKEGDHITNYEWFLHPNCHAIFVKAMSNGVDMKIIRNTYQRGVIEDIIPFTEKSVYRYEYHKSECYDGEQTVRNARSEIGKNEYSWFTNNCETFAKECKCQGSDDTDSVGPQPQKEVDWDRFYAEIISEPGLPESKIIQIEGRLQRMMQRVGCV